MSSRFPKYFMALGLLVAATVTDAVQVTDLYRASAPIADRSDESRRTGMRQAMARVLVKLTGDPAAAGAPATLALRNGADHIVVGRPIWAAADPHAAALAIVADLATA